MTRREPGSFFPSRLFLCFSSHYISLYLFEKHTSTSFPFLRRESNLRCHVVTLSRCHIVTFLIWREEWLRPYIITLNVNMLWWPSFSVLPAVCTLRFSLLYYIASTLLYSTVLYYVPSLLCLPKWLTHNAVCVCGQLGRPLDGGRREGKRSGNGSWNHSISLSNYSISDVMRM